MAMRSAAGSLYVVLRQCGLSIRMNVNNPVYAKWELDLPTSSTTELLAPTELERRVSHTDRILSYWMWLSNRERQINIESDRRGVL